jgi:nucleoside-diphosphate-sugar epimerase
VIIYNGATGGLGRHLGPTVSRRGESAHVITSRLDDKTGLERELESIHPPQPVTFIHLAARVSVPACEANPTEAYRINVALALSTVETVFRWASRIESPLRVIYVSTGHVYAAREKPIRLKEEDATAPRSVYAQTKLAAERELANVAAGHAVPLLVARVFGLIAPGQPPQYVLPGLIARVRSRDLNNVPSLDFVRDYLDARDVSENLLMLAAAAWPAASPVVNVCSGVPLSIRQLLGVVIEAVAPEELEALAGIASAAPGRPDDIPWLVGDPGRFVEMTGGSIQRRPVATTVRDAVAATEAGTAQ